MTVSDGLAQVLSGMARDLLRGSGPVKWCKRCGRKHGSRVACQLQSVAVKLPSGRMVKRQVHPPPEQSR